MGEHDFHCDCHNIGGGPCVYSLYCILDSELYHHCSETYRHRAAQLVYQPRQLSHFQCDCTIFQCYIHHGISVALEHHCYRADNREHYYRLGPRLPQLHRDPAASGNCCGHHSHHGNGASW